MSAREGLFLEKTHMTSLGRYIKETRGELNHVSWPTRRQAVLYTLAVVAISIVVAAYLGGLDWVFARLLEMFVV